MVGDDTMSDGLVFTIWVFARGLHCRRQLAAARCHALLQRQADWKLTQLLQVSSDVQMLLPVLVAILAAKAFADTFVPHSYYHAIMEVSQVPFLPPNPHTHVDLDLVTVSAVMSSPVQTIPVTVKLQDLEALLRDTPHNGYPVVHETPHGSHSCSGLVARNHLLVRTEAIAFCCCICAA